MKRVEGIGRNEVVCELFLKSNTFQTCPRFHIFKFQEDLIKITLMTKSNRGFFSQQRDVILRLMIRSNHFFTSSEIHVYLVHIICKFQENLIKTKGVMVMTSIFTM